MTDVTSQNELLGNEAGPQGADFESAAAGFPYPSLAKICLVAVGSGLLFGYLEVAVKALKYRYDHVFFEWSNPDAVWLIPTAQAALFLAVSVVLFLAAALARRKISLKTLLIPLITLGTLSAFLALNRSGIHDVAKLVFSLGVGTAAGRFLNRRPRLVVRSAALAFVVLGMVTLTRATWLHGIQRLEERRRLASIPLPGRPLPNVLLIVLDTVRALSLELYGYSCSTMPNLTRFSQAGVVFDQAWSVAPWTLPSHASLFTGRWYSELSSDWLHPLDSQYPTLAELLTSHGYATGGFVGNLLFTTRITGLDRGFVSYRDHEVNLKTWLQASEIVKRATKWSRALIPGGEEDYGRKYATDVNRETLKWLDRVGERPYFAFLNYFDAHEPYESFAGFSPNCTAPDSVPVAPGRKRALTAREKDHRDRYDRSLVFMDSALGSLLDSLNARGKLRNTLVIVTADHGEQFGEHGLHGHSNSLYRPLLEVPLVMVMPGTVPAGLHVPQPVSLRDVAVTVADLVNLAPEARFGGSSLRRAWNGRGVGATPLFAETNPYPLSDFDGPVVRGPMKTVVANGKQYIRNGDAVEELYDLEPDPYEVRNLAAEQKGLLAEFRRTLLDIHLHGFFKARTWRGVVGL